MPENNRKRIELQPNDCIRLASQPDGSDAGEWIICGSAGANDQGGSTVCYQAIHNNIRGRLKEFYPKEQEGEFFLLQRMPDLQLCPVGDGATERFREACGEFLQAYHDLEEIKNEDESLLVLNNYMPSYRILYGYSETTDVPGSVYIWTPGDYAGRTFEDYLDSIRVEAGIRPETHLSNILQILATLSDCIGAFHSADLLHLDLKPSNFLVLRDSENNVKPESISLFDINTIRIAGDYSATYITGTPGYQAPETAAGTPFYASDIYSIGAMLLRALAGEKTLYGLYAGRDSVYDYGVYEDLPRLVTSSTLIQSSESASSPDMVEAVITILQKTLHYQIFERYPDCYELKAALLQARDILTRKATAEDISEQDYLDSQPHALVDSTVVLQELLFRHPLYRQDIPDGMPLNVLVLGAGTYGQKFLDLALQSGQMINHPLNLTAYSDTPAKNCRQYLQIRPALNQFVNVTSPELEVIPKDAAYDNYGNLDFRGIPGDHAGFPAHDPEAQRNVLRQILADCSNGGQYHYVFVALGSDALNREVSCALAELTACPIHYVVHREAAYNGSGPHPVFISRSLSLKEIDPDLERWGFNTHLCWEASLNVDIPAVRAKFKSNKYNYRSSLAYALSIPCKLASVGIYETDPNTAVKAFREVIADQAVFTRLVALEHRRWVLEKVTNGWRPPEKTDGAVNYDVFTALGQTKDDARKIHPCLVPSSEAMPLLNFTKQQWNVHSREDDNLDPLDTMSVMMYRSFFALACAFRKDQPMKKLNPEFILKKLEDANTAVIQEYYHYQYCLQNIIDGNATYTRQLRSYAGKLRDAMEAHNVSKTVRETVKAHMDSIEKMLKPVIEANLCKDYKKEDEKLVRLIPFILTYQVRPYMASVFTHGHSDSLKAREILPNVAAATVINPQKIIYLCYYDRSSRSSLLAKALEAVLKYFRERSMACSIDFHLAFAPDVTESTQVLVRERLNTVQNKNKDKLALKYYLPEDEYQTGVLFAERLARNDRRIDLFDCSTPLFTDPIFSAQFLNFIREKYPCFTFNRMNKTFPYTHNCDYLRYIEDRSFLHVNEIFTLTGTEQRRFEYPEFSETYQALWNLYTGKNLNQDWPEHRRILTGIRNWTNLCNLLLEHDQATNALNVIGTIQPAAPSGQKNRYDYYLPDNMFAAMNRLMEKLEKHGKIVSYRLASCGSDLCKLTVQSYLNLSDALKKTIGYLYDHPDAHLVVSGSSIATRSALAVKHLTLPSIHMLWLLEALQRSKLINLLERHDTPSASSFNDTPEVSFYYISDATKDLMTTAGKILEVYIYYAVKKSGYFDDIATSCELFREDSDLVANELDCVLTKGMRSMVIECKATWQLEQGQYHKFNTVAEKTGLDSIKVFIANNLATEDDIQWNQSYSGIVEKNNELRLRGAEMGGIITIYDPLEIQNIADTLRSIMEGTYPGME